MFITVTVHHYNIHVYILQNIIFNISNNKTFFIPSLFKKVSEGDDTSMEIKKQGIWSKECFYYHSNITDIDKIPI